MRPRTRATFLAAVATILLYPAAARAQVAVEVAVPASTPGPSAGLSSLPLTGADVVRYALVAAVLLAAGLALICLARVNRSRSCASS
jgi:hypothetical protein